MQKNTETNFKKRKISTIQSNKDIERSFFNKTFHAIDLTSESSEDFFTRPISPILPVSDIPSTEEIVEKLNKNIIQNELELANLLLKATREENVALANKIIDSEKFNPRATDVNGNIPLHFISGYDQPEVTKKLLEKDRESVAIRNNHDNLPIHLSTFNNKNKNTEILLDELAKQDKVYLAMSINKSGYTAMNYSESHTLINAVRANDIEEAKKSYNEGAIISFQDKEGNTALHYSIKSGNLEITEFLLQNNASKDIVNNKKQRAADLSPIKTSA